VVLHYPQPLVNEPVICRLVKDHDIIFNILRATVRPDEDAVLVLELTGSEEDLDASESYLQQAGVQTQPLELDVVMNEEKCTDCGACVLVCPTYALVRPSPEEQVKFLPDKCIACELCVPACPPRAMEVHY
jgi:ferredoxin